MSTESMGWTPGPWETTGPSCVSDIFSAGDFNIYPPLGHAGPVAIAEGEANARLIDLAAALLALLCATEGHAVDAQAKAQARAALARAGVQP